MRKIASALAAGTAAAVLIGCASGAGAHNTPSSTSAASSPTTAAVLDAKFGQPYPLRYVSGYEPNMQPIYTEYSLTVGAPNTTRVSLLPYGPTPTAGLFAVFHATLKATSEGVTYNSADFTVRQAGGGSSSCLTGEDTFGTGTLHAGQQAAGTVVCDVPSAHGTLVFSPTQPGTGGSLLEWPF